MAETQYGQPLIVPNFVADATETAARGLKRISLEKGGDEGYTERWLQTLISRYPNILPIEDIETAFTPAVPICMELPLQSGSVDNLYATPDGNLIVVETKLFRNPEARRKVVGQIIDYAKDLSALSYENLDKAILRAEAPDGSGRHPNAGLYEAVTSAPVVGLDEIDEQRFSDAVSRNLERGRFLLLVIGDGIQEGTENITEFLQQHAGMHFTLGIVVLAIFELPSEMGGYLVQPRILARTKNINRGIITIEDGRISIGPPIGSKDSPKPTTISEEEFYERLAVKFPTVVPRLKAFTARLEAIGVEIGFGTNSMVLRWSPDERRPWNLGTIAAETTNVVSGAVVMDHLLAQTNAARHINLGHSYLTHLASLVPGAYVKETPKPTGWYVHKAEPTSKGETYITIDELIANEDGWLAAIQEFMAAVTDAHI